MRRSRMPLLALVFVSLAVAGGSGQSRAGGSPTASSGGSYKLVELPTPPTSAAGFPAPGISSRSRAVAVTQKGTVLVLHRGAHPIHGIR